MGRKTYKQATKAAQKRSQLEQMDSANLGTDLSDLIMEEQLSVTERLAGEFIKRVKANIEAADLDVTGKISDITTEEGENGRFYIMGYPHLLYQDLGVNGNEQKLFDTPFTYRDKMPPIAEIKAWINQKGLNLRDNATYYGKTVDIAEGAAWAIAKNIQKKGMKPKNVYSKEVPKLAEDLANELGDIVIAQIFKVL